jgi:hypothetical protein
MPTRLTDLVIVPELFTAGMFQQSLALDAFIASGVAIMDPEIDAFLNASVGGESMSKRFIEALDEDESNVSSDNPASASTAASLSGGSETLVRQSRNKSWSSMDLAAQLYGLDPLGAVQAGVAKYWTTQRQRIVLKSLSGVMADNVANDSEDMVIDITGEAGAAAKFNSTAFIDSLLTLGDRMNGINAIGIHSIVYGTLLKLDLIEFIPDSLGNVNIPTYMGKRVIVDDGMPVDVTVPSVPVFTSVLYGAGALRMGMGSPKTPVEVERDPSAGDGGGQETMYSRVELAVHPVGFAYSGASRVNGKSPTWAELATAGSWDRVYDRKRIPLAFMKSLG